MFCRWIAQASTLISGRRHTASSSPYRPASEQPLPALMSSTAKQPWPLGWGRSMVATRSAGSSKFYLRGTPVIGAGPADCSVFRRLPGATVGFYGGINSGFGYGGIGREEGYWNSRVSFYNRSVNNATKVRNVYTLIAPWATAVNKH